LKAGVLARYVQHGQKVIVGDKMKGTVHLPDAVEVAGASALPAWHKLPFRHTLATSISSQTMSRSDGKIYTLENGIVLP